MKINPKNYFDHYIIDPLAKDLSISERILALSISTLLFPVTFVFLYLNYRKFSPLNKQAVVATLHKRANRLQQLSSSIENICFKKLNPHKQQSTSDLPLRNLPTLIQEHFIDKCYSQKLPEKNQVTVPFANPTTGIIEWRLWSSLSRAEKIQVNNTGTLTHNQLDIHTPEFVVDAKFFAHGQEPYLEGDPRKSHGNDHASRVAIFSAIFAYFYEKYHPDYDVDLQDIALCQIVGAGHDSARQTEGPDVYDETSAALTHDVLDAVGIKNPLTLENCHQAIADKDSPPNARKPLIAKCVQNADCADFNRLLLKAPKQSKTGFDDSRNYLDIYKELKTIAEQKNPEDPSACLLKGKLTFGMFCHELDVVREEMNDFIYQTHQKQFRQQAVQSDNYYNAVLNTINPLQFPLLTAVLTQIGIKTTPPSSQEMQQEQTIGRGKEWQQYGFKKISSTSLQKLFKVLNSYKDSEARSLSKQIEAELTLRENTQKTYHQVISYQPLDIKALMIAYAHLSQEMKNQKREEIYQHLIHFSQTQKKPWREVLPSLVQHAPAQLKETYQVVFLDIMHHVFKEKFTSRQFKEIEGFEYASYLKTEAETLLTIYHASDKNLRDPGVQTTVALALEKAAQIFIKLDQNETAKEALDIAAKRIILDDPDLEKLFQDKPYDTFMYLPFDCGFLRKRKMRICQKNFQLSSSSADTEKYIELSLELTSQSRQHVKKILKLIPPENQDIIPATYYKKEGENYLADQHIQMGTDLRLELTPGVELLIGSRKKYWNQYHLLRVRVKAGTSLQKVHQTLAQIGLPMALLPSRSEDIANETLARSLAFRFPQLVALYKHLPSWDIYGLLTSAQKKVIDNDVENFKTSLVNNHHYEMVQPEIAQEAWKAGVRGVGTFIYGGPNISQTAEVLKKIIEKGMMSSEERYQNGILGAGCVPKSNYKAGSGNQVFGRILTKNLFDSRFSLKNFPVNGQVFILLDTKVLERMPYSYAEDKGGVRNPLHYKPVHFAQQQRPSFHFKGQEKIQKQKSFTEHVQKLSTKAFPLNETMFDLNIGAHYIHKIVVGNESDRYSLIAALNKAGIYHIREVPLEKVIVIAQELNPELVDHFDQTENPSYGKAQTDSVDYI